MNKLQKINDDYWYYPVIDFVYDENYIKKYIGYASTKLGKKILKARLKILKNYTKVLDIGVGSGQLIYNKENSKGYDVNPFMVKQLKKERLWYNPYKQSLEQFDVISFFDSFEHIRCPEILLKKIKKSVDVIIAIPIFYSYQDLISSKHFRSDEHFHYFTFLGFLNYMKNFNFKCHYISDIECTLGRENIFTFIFKKQ